MGDRLRIPVRHHARRQRRRGGPSLAEGVVGGLI